MSKRHPKGTRLDIERQNRISGQNTKPLSIPEENNKPVKEQVAGLNTQFVGPIFRPENKNNSILKGKPVGSVSVVSNKVNDYIPNANPQITNSIKTPVIKQSPLTGKPIFLFITGWYENRKSLEELGMAIMDFYHRQLGSEYQILVSSYDRPIETDLRNAGVTNSVLHVVGFSFGGQRAIELCENIGRTVQTLVLIDPVNYHRPNEPNQTGFTVPPNVVKAICHYRNAKAMPWSGKIANESPQYKNHNYWAVSSNPWQAHGEYVWNRNVAKDVRA